MSWSDATLRNLATRLKWTTEQLSFLRSCRMEQPWARCIERLLDNSEMLVLLHPGRLGYPSLWEDERFFRPLQPIVGVCSFEVEAYLAWLNYSSAQKYALPTEYQWESAARGSLDSSRGRKWAFGHDFSNLSCNIETSGQNKTTPIAAYPAGVTPDGIHDLSGNVWEWTSSQWIEKYSSSEKDASRLVVRGGSWDNSIYYARSSCRGRFTRGYQYGGLGFRLVSLC